jgi:hypothetical protein
LFSNSSIKKYPKLQPTSELYALMKKALDIKDLISIELSLTLWHKEETLLITTALEENLSTVLNSLIKTFCSSMMCLTYYLWPTLVPIQTDPNSSLLLYLAHGWMESIPFSAKFFKEKKLCRCCMLWVLILEDQPQKQQSLSAEQSDLVNNHWDL